jgi:hypothetical protein
MLEAQAIKLNPSAVFACAAMSATLMQLADVEAKQLVLNCDISEGAPEGYRSIQIVIDEEKKFVIYNSQLTGTNPLRQVGEGQYVDLSMKISLNNAKLLMANDVSGSFLMTKSDGHFVHAWVVPIETKAGAYIPFANIHSGTCAKGPFD